MKFLTSNLSFYFKRILAFVIDSIIGIIVFYLIKKFGEKSISFLYNIFDKSVEYYASIVLQLPSLWLLGYYFLIIPLMESSKSKGTPGKRLFNLIVTDLEGNKIKFLKAFFRNILKLISIKPFFVVYIIALFITPKFKPIHDLFLQTKVESKKSIHNESTIYLR